MTTLTTAHLFRALPTPFHCVNEDLQAKIITGIKKYIETINTKLYLHTQVESILPHCQCMKESLLVLQLFEVDAYLREFCVLRMSTERKAGSRQHRSDRTT